MEYNDVEILFVEDSTEDALLTIRVLNKCGLVNNILHVKDGEEALDFLSCAGKYILRNGLKKPKLVLLDLKMPKISGLEVLEKIKSDPSTKSIPVVILTSSKEEKDIMQCYAKGANSYVVKPVESDIFFDAIKTIGLYWMNLNQELQL